MRIVPYLSIVRTSDFSDRVRVEILEFKVQGLPICEELTNCTGNLVGGKSELCAKEVCNIPTCCSSMHF